MCQRLLQLVCLLFICLVGIKGDFKRVCYYSGWAIYRNAPNNLDAHDIDPTLCTHLLFAFAALDVNTTQMRADTPRDIISYTAFTNLKQKNPHLKTMLSVGGWNMGSEPFMYVVESSDSMQEFANKTIEMLRYYNFDGIDIDWEYPAARGSPHQDKQRFTQLLQEVRSAFENEPNRGSKDRLLLSVAVGSGIQRTRESYQVHGISQNVDFINLMTYDFHGQWEDTVNVHSALYSDDDLNIDRSAQYWASHGAEKSKLILGMPFYGHTYHLASTDETQVGANHTGGATMPYYQLCKRIKSKNITEHVLTKERVPYIVDGHLWVGYDNAQSLFEKAEYVKKNQYGGVMVWAIDLDDTTGACGDGRYPLMNALKNGLLGSGPGVVG